MEFSFLFSFKFRFSFFSADAVMLQGYCCANRGPLIPPRSFHPVVRRYTLTAFRALGVIEFGRRTSLQGTVVVLFLWVNP